MKPTEHSVKNLATLYSVVVGVALTISVEQLVAAQKSFDEVEPTLGREWASAKAHSKLAWDKARHATRDAWERIENAKSGPACGVKS